MTIIQSQHDFDIRILFNSPLLFLLHVTNPKISGKIYHKQKRYLSLKKTRSNPLTSLKFINHDVAIRTQYFLEWRLIAICFVTSILSYFSLNPLFLFYIRFNWEDEEHITSFYASLIYPFFYGSSILSLTIWMLLSRLQIWNMGIFANINQYHPQQQQQTTNTDINDINDINTRMKIINFKRNSYESRINGYLICLRWLLFGYTISLYLLSVSQNYYHSIIAVCISGIFYPNLLITSASVLIYSIDQLSSVKNAFKFIAVSTVLGWILLPLFTAIIGELLAWWAPFLFIGFLLSMCIIYLMCVGPSRQTKLQINSINDNDGSDGNDDSVPLIGNTKQQIKNKNKRQQSVSDGIFGDIQSIEIEEDEYKEIDNDINNDDISIWKMVGCDRMCKYNPFIMSSSIGMFQISTFLLNIESFLINSCLSIYFTWYGTAVRNDFGQTFILSAIQMLITGIVVLFCVVFISRFIHKLYYYYSFRIWITMCSIVLSLIMSDQYLTKYLYWICTPIIISLIVLLNISTNLIINNNTPNGCYTFILASNQIFKLTAFMIAPFLMGMFTTFDDGQNTFIFWRIITSILSIQLSISILMAFIQGFIVCFCNNNHRKQYKHAQNDPLDINTN